MNYVEFNMRNGRQTHFSFSMMIYYCMKPIRLAAYKLTIFAIIVLQVIFMFAFFFLSKYVPNLKTETNNFNFQKEKYYDFMIKCFELK